jgi:hypothetical protein
VDYLPTRKQFLLKNKRIEKAGRGRISADNLSWLLEQYNAGQRFSDWEPEVTETEGEKRIVNKNKPIPRRVKEEIPTEINIYWPEEDYNAIEIRNNKRVIRSMREACNNCMASLVQCACRAYGRTPKIVAIDGRGSVDVTIERRTNG